MHTVLVCVTGIGYLLIPVRYWSHPNQPICRCPTHCQFTFSERISIFRRRWRPWNNSEPLRPIVIIKGKYVLLNVINFVCIQSTIFFDFGGNLFLLSGPYTYFFFRIPILDKQGRTTGPSGCWGDVGWSMGPPEGHL